MAPISIILPITGVRPVVSISNATKVVSLTSELIYALTRLLNELASFFMDDTLHCEMGKYSVLRLGDGPAFYFFNTVFEFKKFLLKCCQTLIQFCIRKFDRCRYFLPCFLDFRFQILVNSINFTIEINNLSIKSNNLTIKSNNLTIKRN